MAGESRFAPATPRVIPDWEQEVVRDDLRLFSELQLYRNVHAGQWEEAASLILPTSRNTFFYGTYNWPGTKQTDRQIDGTGGLALHRFCAIADSLVTPRNMTWHGLAADGPDADYVMKDRASKLWFEGATRKLFSARYAATANFAAQNYNSWQSLGAFGNSTMFVDALDATLHHGIRGLRYRGVPLGETYFAENHQGMVTTVVRWFRLTAYQAVQKWGRAALPATLCPALEANAQTPFDFLHVVKPRDPDDYDPDRLDEKGKPFLSRYISINGTCLMGQEGGYRVFPYAVSRYDQTPGEVYGRGPAQIVLPALKTLNAQKKVFLKQGHRSADPVLLTHDDGLIDGFSMRPGALNKGGMTADGKRLVDILPTGNIQIAKEMLVEERGLIDDTFLVSLFKVLTEHPDMTATQVIELVNEKGMLVAPTLGRQHDEKVASMVERELDLMAELGMLDEMPARLKEARGEYRVVDTSPLAKASRMNEAAGFNRWVDNLRQLATDTQDPSWLDRVDNDTAAPEIADIYNVPTRWVADDQKVAMKRKGRADAAQREQRIQALPAEAAMVNAQAKAAAVAGPPGMPGAPA